MISGLKRNVTQEDRVLVTIVTDGYENSSVHWSGPQIKSLVEELRHEGWTFAYIGANQDVEAVAGSMGIRNTLSFDADEEGMEVMRRVSVSARSKFMKKLEDARMFGHACLEEPTDYFAEK